MNLKDGLSSLMDCVDQLNAGAQKLADGTVQFDEQGMQVLKNKLGLAENEIKGLETVLNAVQDYTAEFETFAGAPENASDSVKFIFKVSK